MSYCRKKIILGNLIKNRNNSKVFRSVTDDFNYTIKTQFECKYHFKFMINKYTVPVVIQFDSLVQFRINKDMLIN